MFTRNSVLLVYRYEDAYTEFVEFLCNCACCGEFRIRLNEKGNCYVVTALSSTAAEADRMIRAADTEHTRLLYKYAWENREKDW